MVGFGVFSARKKWGNISCSVDSPPAFSTAAANWAAADTSTVDVTPGTDVDADVDADVDVRPDRDVIPSSGSSDEEAGGCCAEVALSCPSTC